MSRSTWDAIAYCGPAPLPAELWVRWNWDPWLLASLGAVAAVWLLRGQGGRPGMAFWSGFALLIVIFVSPLCALSSALFAARSLHHLLLVAAAAPLFALAGIGPRRLPLGIAAAAHAMILWAWHVPDLYAWALANTAGYWLMQASLFGSALAFWNAVVRPRGARPAVVLALAAFAAQMGLLSALITFAPAPFYLPHLLTTLPYGLSPLEDQQLAGLIMWTIGTPFYLGIGLWLFLRRLGPPAPEAATR